MNRFFPVGALVFLFFLACNSQKKEENRNLTVDIEGDITLAVMDELSVMDYQAELDLYLGYAFETEGIYLFNSNGEVMHQWDAPEGGSPDDYGRIYGISFFDEESLLVLSLFNGMHRIDFSGQIVESIALPFQPGITGYQAQRKAARIDDSLYVIDLPGRVNPFDQIENKYQDPLYELWNSNNGGFEPVVVLPEESKYRQFNVINYPTFTYHDGKLYHVNDNEPVVYIYAYQGNSFVYERSIALSPPVFYEPKESLLDEDDEFYEAENYLLEVYEDRLFVFYTSGISPDVFEENMVDEDYDRLFAEHEHKWVTVIHLGTDAIAHLKLPSDLDYVQTQGPNGLFLARKNLYFSEDESDTNRFPLLRFNP